MSNHSNGPHPPFPLPGHIGQGHAQGWLPNQIGRPPPPGSHAMHHHFSFPAHGMPGQHSQHMSSTGSSPIPHSISPESSYGQGGAPLPPAGHNSTLPFQPLGAAPLAGSLSTVGSTMVNPARRDSLSPFAHTALSETATPAQRTASPAHGSGPASRPTSSTGQTGTSSPHKVEGRTGPPGGLGPLPPSMFAGVKAVISPSENGDTSTGPTPPPSKGGASSGPPVAIAMEGLSHQGAHMGPPATLHDRVVFVSNVGEFGGKADDSYH